LVLSSLFLQLNDSSAALDQVNDKNDESQDQKDVDESPKRVRRDHAEEPQDKQNDQNCPKHFVPFSQETNMQCACAAPKMVLANSRTAQC
jgi:hypothetical protein